ncbi:NAD-dependent epimerase/dehydratase family protein [Sinorhizobium alkalisoli]|uniref:NAD-dependent epimerase/dehydratase family protein n=1 Tax=Sinorhizobium alkalisoli TaxID=1752398 RepID=UPI00124F035D|nr:NAD-dependent epimerase/dehydratase family protein [Sinorhizobium alkalisoli]QFI69333.1 Nucleoside-diphosphate-sugar epimerase [Sinorhizobium alkalisoli]
MQVFVMGGTGTIGLAVVRELVERGHEVVGLARSSSSAAALEEVGASALAGDIRMPGVWLKDLPKIEAVIHAATDFAADMGDVDSQLLDALLPVLAKMGKPRFVYTGGCWLYGATGSKPAVETSPFDPLPAFAWMVPQLRRVLAATEIRGTVVHPAMVYNRSGGVFLSFLDHARKGGPVPVVDGGHVRWPLVHADDLAVLYALVLECAEAGQSYNGAALTGLPVGPLASAIATVFGGADCNTRIISADEVAKLRGEWARGYALDQSMSGEKARSALGWRPVHLDPLADLLLPWS